jgi:hypothetical protein
VVLVPRRCGDLVDVSTGCWADEQATVFAPIAITASANAVTGDFMGLHIPSRRPNGYVGCGHQETSENIPGKYGMQGSVPLGRRGPTPALYDACGAQLGAAIEWATGVGLEAALAPGARPIAPIAAAANNGAMCLIVFTVLPSFVGSPSSA